MRKAVMILLALAAIRLLPRALRQETRAAELLAVLFQVTLAAVANTSKAYATEQRTAVLEKRLQSQRGTVGGFGASVPNLGTTQTGTAQSSNPANLKTQNADNNGVTSGQIGGAAAHYHAMDHAHGFDHFHFSQVAGDYNNFAASYDTTLATLAQMKAALQAAGIL